MQRGVFLLILATIAIGAGPATQPDDPDAKVWNLTSYLTGTPLQIRATLYGEVQRFRASIHETNREIEDARRDIVSDSAACLKRARDSATYHALKIDMDAGKKELDEARESGTTQDRFVAGGKYNHAKSAIERIERDALASDQNLLSDHKRFDVLSKKLEDERASLAASQQWAKKIANAARSSFALEWPLSPGAKGFLGDVKVKQVIDDAFVCDYSADEIITSKNSGEGFVSQRGIVHPVELLVLNSGLKDIKVGSTVSLDRTFEVAQGKMIGDSIYYFVKPSPTDADRLWERISVEPTDGEILGPAHDLKTK